MADEIKETLEEHSGYTSFGGTPRSSRMYLQPLAGMGKFFARFFTDKAAPEVMKSVDNKQLTSKEGDTIVQTDLIRDTSMDSGTAIGGVERNPILPQQELNRRRRYREYEEMDEYPEISSAFDIFADDCTQKGSRSERWTIKSESEDIVNTVQEFFEDIKLEKKIWDIARNTVKYGDCFTESIVDLNNTKKGIRRIKILNPNWMLRVENEFGHIQKFLQEVPNYEQLQQNSADSYGQHRAKKYITLDIHQITHFRLHTSAPEYYPYGKSIAGSCHRTFRSLKMMEEAMMIYRISRAPERRIFYVDTGNMPSSKAENFIERFKARFKKEKYYNTKRGSVDAKYNPMSMDEDFYVPIRNGKGTKIETLPGAQNLGEIEDVRYYRDKLLAALKVPKDFIVEKDGSPERKANLSQLDVKFARTIQRIQTDIETGLEKLAKAHLKLLGKPESEIRKLRIKLPEPSDMSMKRKLDLDEQKVRTVQGILQLGIFPKEYVYKEFYDLTNTEIERIKKMVDAEKEELMQDQLALQAGMTAIEVEAQPDEATPGKMAKPKYNDAGGQEGRSNKTPTSESTGLERGLFAIHDDRKREAWNRIIEKRKAKLSSQPSE